MYKFLHNSRPSGSTVKHLKKDVSQELFCSAKLFSKYKEGYVGQMVQHKDLSLCLGSVHYWSV